MRKIYRNFAILSALVTTNCLLGGGLYATQNIHLKDGFSNQTGGSYDSKTKTLTLSDEEASYKDVTVDSGYTLKVRGPNTDDGADIYCKGTYKNSGKLICDTGGFFQLFGTSGNDENNGEIVAKGDQTKDFSSGNYTKLGCFSIGISSGESPVTFINKSTMTFEKNSYLRFYNNSTLINSHSACISFKDNSFIESRGQNIIIDNYGTLDFSQIFDKNITYGPYGSFFYNDIYLHGGSILKLPVLDSKWQNLKVHILDDSQKPITIQYLTSSAIQTNRGITILSGEKLGYPDDLTIKLDWDLKCDNYKNIKLEAIEVTPKLTKNLDLSTEYNLQGYQSNSYSAKVTFDSANLILPMYVAYPSNIFEIDFINGAKLMYYCYVPYLHTDNKTVLIKHLEEYDQETGFTFEPTYTPITSTPLMKILQFNNYQFDDSKYTLDLSQQGIERVIDEDYDLSLNLIIPEYTTLQINGKVCVLGKIVCDGTIKGSGQLIIEDTGTFEGNGSLLGIRVINTKGKLVL